MPSQGLESKKLTSADAWSLALVIVLTWFGVVSIIGCQPIEEDEPSPTFTPTLGTPLRTVTPTATPTGPTATPTETPEATNTPTPTMTVPTPTEPPTPDGTPSTDGFDVDIDAPEQIRIGQWTDVEVFIFRDGDPIGDGFPVEVTLTFGSIVNSTCFPVAGSCIVEIQGLAPGTSRMCVNLPSYVECFTLTFVL